MSEELVKAQPIQVDDLVLELENLKIPLVEELMQDIDKIELSKSFWRVTIASGKLVFLADLVMAFIILRSWLLGLPVDALAQTFLLIAFAVMMFTPLYWMRKTRKIETTKEELKDILADKLAEPLYNSISAHNAKLDQLLANVNMQYALHGYSNTTHELFLKIKNAVPEIEKNKDNLARVQSRYPLLRDADKKSIENLGFNLQPSFLFENPNEALEKLASEVEIKTGMVLKD